jgi:hypothetical protein
VRAILLRAGLDGDEPVHGSGGQPVLLPIRG